MPVLWLPLLGPAYNRACEATCDRFGAFSVKDMDGAVKAILVFASGKALAGKVDIAAFSQQALEERGFFVSWYELISGYPTLSQRAANLVAIKDEQPPPAYDRNPFAYVFALFSIGGGRANMGGAMIMVAVIALLAAIAIPNLLRAKISANDALAKGTLRTLATASETYATSNEGRFPVSVENLTDAQPPYLRTAYCGQTIAGFTYTCRFSQNGYQFEATPVADGSSGSTTFTMTTGGVLTPAVMNEERWRSTGR
jgi:Tfp pilus assembly protein PilE